jgi:hypothetical protein
MEAVVGRIEQLWRYPVSSLGGERLETLPVGPRGADGDRSWCLVDVETGRAAAPETEERWRAALFLSSRRGAEAPEIGFPDGTWHSVRESPIGRRLSDHFGFAVMPRPYEAAPGSTDAAASNRYDPSPVHLVTTSALEHLTVLAAPATIDARRFRPTVLVRTTAPPAFLEKSWLGVEIRAGSVVLEGMDEAKRCGMTFIAQPGLQSEPEILRAVLRNNQRNFGIYCNVRAPGVLAVGDAVIVGSD